MDQSTAVSVPARLPSFLSCSPPSALAFAALVLVTCGSLVAANLPHDGLRFAVPFLFGVSIHAMGAYRCHSPGDLRKARSLVIGSVGVFITLLLTGAMLERANIRGPLPINYGPILVTAGTRPVVAAFFQERARVRVDSRDTFFAAGGVWAMVSGVAILVMGKTNSPESGVLGGANLLGLGLGWATLVLGAALSLQGLIRARLRRRWFRRVAEGKITGYRLSGWDKAEAAPPRVLDDPSRKDEEAGVVLFRGAESGYRSHAPEALGMVPIDASPWRLTRGERWVLEVVAGITLPFVFTGWMIR